MQLWHTNVYYNRYVPGNFKYQIHYHLSRLQHKYGFNYGYLVVIFSENPDKSWHTLIQGTLSIYKENGK